MPNKSESELHMESFVAMWRALYADNERLKRLLADLADDTAFLVSAHKCGEYVQELSLEGVRQRIRDARSAADKLANSLPSTGKDT